MWDGTYNILIIEIQQKTIFFLSPKRLDKKAINYKVKVAGEEWFLLFVTELNVGHHFFGGH